MKRTANILCAGALLAGLLAGCAAQEPETSQEGTAPPAFSEKVDFQGETIVFAYPWTIEPYEATPSGEQRRKQVEQIEKAFNVKIENKTVSGSFYNDQMTTTILAGKPMGHFLIAYGEFTADYYKAGVFADLTQAMQATGIDFSDGSIYNQLVRKYTQLNGKQVGFYNELPNCLMWYYNKRMLSEIGVDMEQLVEDKEWTFDKLRELGKKLTKDPTGSGEPSVYGIGAMQALTLVQSLTLANNGEISGVDPGTLQPEMMWQNANTLEAMNFVYGLCVTDKVCRPNLAGESWTQGAKDFADGKYAFMCSTLDYAGMLQKIPMQDDFGIVPAPIGPQADDYIHAVNGISYHFIPVTYQDRVPELLILYDALSQPPEGYDAESMWRDNTEPQVRDEASLAVLENMRYGDRSRLEPFTFWGVQWTEPSYAMLMEWVCQDQITPNLVAEQYDQMIQALLDDKWGSIRLTGLAS
ncbi:MAG TPA: extracellular solute-binding protein [Firmicutes bacterium]|nr:extracellular solute-binding protein [Bacillota bacterium]